MAPFTLFEVSFEICSKVGGLHSVLATKAKTLVEKHGDEYVAVGPWLLADRDQPLQFSEEPGFEAFGESCRAMDLPVRVGRWHVPGRPLTVLVEFSKLLARKDEILAALWERYRVDSLQGSWDYVEPVMFGHAAGLVIEKWLTEFVVPSSGQIVAHFHDWTTGAGLLHLKSRLPEIGSVFTAHGTVLGRTLAGLSVRVPDDVKKPPEQAAAEAWVTSRHSLESVCAREADVLTTVSERCAHECEAFLGRLPHPITPLGIELDAEAELASGTAPTEAATRLRDFARRFLGDRIDDAAIVLTSGRYDMHNKGLDVLLDALALLSARPGRRVVLFVLTPTGNSGPRADLLQRLREGVADGQGPLGIATHNLFDPERDPILRHCQRAGLTNAIGTRVRVVHVPVYLNGADGMLNLRYETVLRSADLTVFPAAYEPWGYGPLESLALGVPTITSDASGFGAFAAAMGLAPDGGVFTLERREVDDKGAVERLAALIEELVGVAPDHRPDRAACQRSAESVRWSQLVVHCETAYQQALDSVRTRLGSEPRRLRRRFSLVQVAARTVSQRPRLHRFEVAPSIPPELRQLETIARNLWWTWNHDAQELFAQVAANKWEAVGRNPIAFLNEVSTADLQRAAKDKAFRSRLDATAKRLERYLATATLHPRGFGIAGGDGKGRGPTGRHPVAYFCAEFGLHESLPIYSGGLGILAGDHLKSASDLDLPLVAVGLFYRRGYLRQRITANGDQIAADIDNDASRLPLELVVDDDRTPLAIEIELPSAVLVLQAWRVMVGRVPLYLLDADVPANRPEDRSITHHLYGGDHENRLRQEIVLGRGGVRLLLALGIEPSAWHLNEGHAAFVAIERTSRYVRAEGLSFEEAHELVRATTAFTTHTPIPAGHDRHGEHVIRRYFSNVEQWAGVPWERFYQLGRDGNPDGAFNMTYFAARFSGYVNGVSKLHGEVSRTLLQPLWPPLLEGELPVRSITNGVHLPTWVAPSVAGLVGATERPVTGNDFAQRGATLRSADLWNVRCGLRGQLVRTIAARTEAAFLRRHDSTKLMAQTLAGLDPDALWIGFARRFAPYKRADLLLRDPARLARLVDDPERPVRLVFAGKAHPADQHGQDILRRVAQLTRSEPFVGKVVLLEDYDMELGRALVQGVDVWLNNPIRPLEASGTSGMKAAANGALNLSIADGWWIEAFDGHNGFTIATLGQDLAPSVRDDLESDHLLRLLETEVVPLWFDRDADGVPERWLERVRRSFATIPAVFDSLRMVAEYRDQAYAPLAASARQLGGDDRTALVQLAREHQALRKHFADVRFHAVRISDTHALEVLDTVDARVDLALGALSPAQVSVELVLGQLNQGGELANPRLVELVPAEQHADGTVAFAGSVTIEHSGAYAYGFRVRPRQRGAHDGILDDLVLWADAAQQGGG